MDYCNMVSKEKNISLNIQKFYLNDILNDI